jgi:hypothetical protein
MLISTYLKPNIHQNSPEILGVIWELLDMNLLDLLVYKEDLCAWDEVATLSLLLIAFNLGGLLLSPQH